MKSSWIISPLKMELVSRVTETCLPSLSGVDVRCKVLMWTGQWALKATVCVWIHQAAMSVLMMEANTVSEIVDTNSICKWLIVQEDW